MRLDIVLVAGLALLVSASAASTPCSYVISANDTLFDVGKRYNLTLAEVTAANPQLSDVNILQLGTVIALPCGNATATSGESVLDLLAHRADMTTLFRAVVAAGFADTLADESLVATVFAPNNTAFENLLAKVLTNQTAEELLADKAALAELLSYHVVPEEALEAAQLTNGRNLTTLLEEEFVEVFKPANTTRLATSSGQKVRVVATDLEAGKAVVHITKGVLLPASFGVELPSPEAGCIHVVKEGDILFDLAAQYDTTVDSLLDLNPQLQANPTLLPLGTELILYPECEL
ncbi:hypothetical protein CHLNCDRAFT_49959 [Chlorella variabilis]|uniref:LysM domain-containing protein n=1 Tax=Chlorella variabilis TaxID=554065 RepID=E1Z4U4_CHLVA|nr:hypothetical protein CHLNCDRAFT_49959 [Chlorella variabilis]EFN59119.1 hypothetical protein CHLNCDRAFT_49959 [Chlorella variabilis]|eukprot:XP_005851221.1 hypothetical protein CHLNCDRAFT_49959 [Chlorella variabilis]